MRILVISSSRADWGLLAPVVSELRRRPGISVVLALTGQHLMPGSESLKLIEAEGEHPDCLIDMELGADDGPAALSRAMGLATRGAGEAIAKFRPDLMLVLGDRYEILSAVSAALVARVPVAHLCGGDVTEGAIDDAARHAITKLSSLHFVSNAAAAVRVAQLGEADERIFNVGSPGLDRIMEKPLLARGELLAELGLPESAGYFVVTYHPATLAAEPFRECRAMLEALGEFPDYGLIFSGSNADPDGRTIEAEVRDFAAARANAVFYETLGSLRYFSTLANATAVIGNSSSGLYEAPTFKVPTVNIGDRQKGRLRAASVIDCTPHPAAIADAIRQAMQLDCSNVVNPYGDGHAAQRITDVLCAIGDPATLLRKTFVDRLT